MNPDSETKKLETRLQSSWESNAQLWTEAVRGATIPSRRAGSDQAIVDAIKRFEPKSLIDIGCGEGWLLRRLRDELDCFAVGVDASGALIERAKMADPGGNYAALSYSQLAQLPAGMRGPFDLAVCNFALLDQRLAPTLKLIGEHLAKSGRLIVQTLHPMAFEVGRPYQDGWREESFTGISPGSWQSMPWYFRTVESWVREIRAAGMTLTDIDEPLDQTTFRPLSILFTCQSL